MAFVASVQFSNTITVGSVIIAALVIVLGGVFTLRTNIQSYWRGLAEERQAKIDQLETDAAERERAFHESQEHSRDHLMQQAEEQRQVRHELKNELAAANALLASERAKTDLTALMEAQATQHHEAMDKIVEGLAKQQEVIELLTPIVQAIRDDVSGHMHRRAAG